MVATAEVPEDKVAAPSIDDDGAKIIESIEESVVAVVKDIPDERDYEHC